MNLMSLRMIRKKWARRDFSWVLVEYIVVSCPEKKLREA